MNLPANLFSSAFKKEKMGLTLSFLIGIMVYLGCLAMGAQAVLARTAFVWRHDLQNRLTLEIPPLDGEGAAAREQRANQIANILLQRPEIVGVKLLPESETARLLKPWLADPSLLESLALPRLMDIEVALGRAADVAALKQSVKSIAADAQIHQNEQGMGELLGFLKGLGGLASVMLLLTGVALVAIVKLVCRAAMEVQRETIELLHYMGATDSVVARQFQGHVRRLAVPASIAGFLFAALTVGLLAVLLGSLGGVSLVSPLSWATVGGVMAVIPLAASAVSIFTARLSVQKLLRRLT